MSDDIRILMIDDDEDEFVIIRDLLDERDGFPAAVTWTDDPGKGMRFLLGAEYDAVLVDYRLGSTDGLALIAEAMDKGCRLPMILMTGQGDRDVDMAAMKKGAADYLDKNNLTAELLERSLRYAVERQGLINELKDALDKIKTLKGLVPICAHCKKIRDDTGYWNQLEQYIERHSGAEFSHGICPDCMEKLYPDTDETGDGQENAS